MADTPPEGWLQIGHLRRPHGLRGDIFVQLTTDRVERLDPGSRLWAAGRTFTVSASRRAGNGRMIARFDGVADRTTAETLANLPLYAEPIDDPDTLWAHDLIGCRVVDQLGIERGVCTAIVANPASDLLELDSGALVPSVFVATVLDGVITVDVPDGLFT